MLSFFFVFFFSGGGSEGVCALDHTGDKDGEVRGSCVGVAGEE